MWQNNPYAWLLFIAGGTCLGLSFLAWRRRNVDGARHLAAMMLAVSVWALAYAFELYRTDLPTQFLLTQVEYFGVLLIPGLWVTFAARYTNQTTWLRQPLGKIGLVVPPVLGLLCVWVPLLQPLMWLRYTQTEFGGQILFASTKGPAFYTLVIPYSYAALIGGTFLLARALRRSAQLYRQQIFIMLLGSLIPWAANILYISGFSPFGVLDLTPFAFTLTGAVISFGLFRYNLLDIAPVARESIFEHITEGVLVSDARGRVLLVNPAARRMLALNRDVTGLPEPIVLTGWTTVTDSPQGLQEYVRQTPTGPAVFELRRSPFYDRTGRAMGQLVLLSDVTARHHYEAQLRQARDEAQAASLAKDQFLATVSHELRTPLTVIMGYTEILLEKAQHSAQPKTVKQLQKVDEAAQQLLSLIDDVLDFNKLETGQVTLRVTPFAVNDLITEVARLSQPLMAQGHNQLTVEMEDALGTMTTDLVRVRQILYNLLANAAKFTQQGQIWLRANPAENTWVVFEVQDTGVGIPPEKLALLFQPFVQADSSRTRQYGGMGLGLVISHHLCQRLGGTISVVSQPGAGSTFTVRLPRSVPTHE